MYIKKIDYKEQEKLIKEDNDQTASHGAIAISTEVKIDPFYKETKFFEDSISHLERTSIKLYPIVKEALKKMVDESVPEGQETTFRRSNSFDDEPDMHSVLGFLN